MSKSELIENYRKAFFTIKVFPFIYTAVLLILSPFETFLSLQWAELLALFFFTCMPSIILCLVLSYAVRLCPWHRAQCFIMLLPLSIPLCRIFYPDLSIVWVWLGVSTLLLASLVNAYFVFIKPSVRR